MISRPTRRERNVDTMSTSGEPANAPDQQIGGCLRLAGSSLEYVPLGVATPGSALTADVTGRGTAPSLGAGVAVFEDIAFDWTHPCDETVYVISGELVVTGTEGTVTGRPGDILFMSRGAQLRYETTGVCTVFAGLNLTEADHA